MKLLFICCNFLHRRLRRNRLRMTSYLAPAISVQWQELHQRIKRVCRIISMYRYSLIALIHILTILPLTPFGCRRGTIKVGSPYKVTHSIQPLHVHISVQSWYVKLLSFKKLNHDSVHSGSTMERKGDWCYVLSTAQ